MTQIYQDNELVYSDQTLLEPEKQDMFKLGYFEGWRNYNSLIMVSPNIDEAFVKAFCTSSAAKTVHHGFVGGLLEHTLSVARMCEYFCGAYPILKRDLLIAAALCHDIGKAKGAFSVPRERLYG